MKNPFITNERKIFCEHCNYVIVEPYPEDSICPNCQKFSSNILEALSKSKRNNLEDKKSQYDSVTRTPSSEINGVRTKPELSDEDITDEYIKFYGITSVEMNQIFSSNEKFTYLLDLTHNLNFLATGFLGGVLDKMLLITEETGEDKCLFLKKNNIIYVICGMFTEKKGKRILNQLSLDYDSLIRKGNVNSSKITTKLKSFQNFIRENLGRDRILTNKEIPYLDECLRVDYIGLSSISTGVVSLLLDEHQELKIEVPDGIKHTEKEHEFKEDNLTARIEAISSNTQGMTLAYPRWIAVRIKFQKYRFLTFKEYPNDYFLYLLTEGNLDKIQNVEDKIAPLLSDVISQPFKGDLKPFNELKNTLKDLFRGIPGNKF
ncbi:MAG: hypothetical protein KGD61_05755 [Candidatus Lokiarchaeota archaeon]|nr:hypothetical protein [Candidatus Lokiarchaeota archaeon]